MKKLIKNTYLSITEENKNLWRIYAAMKKQLAEDIIQLTAPIKEKYHSDACADAKIIQLLADNAKKVRQISKDLLTKVQEKVGVVSFCLYNNKTNSLCLHLRV